MLPLLLLLLLLVLPLELLELLPALRHAAACVWLQFEASMHESCASVAEEHRPLHCDGSDLQFVASVWQRLAQFDAGPLPDDPPELPPLLVPPLELLLLELVLHAAMTETSAAAKMPPRPHLDPMRSSCILPVLGSRARSVIRKVTSRRRSPCPT